jgi:hypothetical protein
MKTSELTGAALDWAVAQAEGVEIRIVDRQIVWPEDYSPSTDWGHGGVIIEREGMGVWMYQWNEQGEPEAGWYAEDKDGDHVRTGTTPLEAAMRCYVASKLGDKVELPPNL